MRMTEKISGLQRSALRALPYRYLRLAVEKALEGIPIADALTFSYEEWIHHEEELEKKIGEKYEQKNK